MNLQSFERVEIANTLIEICQDFRCLLKYLAKNLMSLFS